MDDHIAVLPIGYRQLRHVLALAEHGNFHRAAEAEFITQPALTKSIRNLEDKLEAKLFDRHPKCVLPTAYGRIVVEQAHKVMDAINEIETRVQTLKRTDYAELKIGISQCFSESAINTAVANAINHYPSIQVSTVTDSVTKLNRMLSQGKLDLALVDCSDGELPNGFEIFNLPVQSGIVYCRNGHPLQEKNLIKKSDLKKYYFAGPELPKSLENYFLGKNHTALFQRAQDLVAVKCVNHSMAKSIILNSDCWGCAPRMDLSAELQNGSLVTLNVKSLHSQFSPAAIYLSNQSQSPSITAFLDEVSHVMK